MTLNKGDRIRITHLDQPDFTLKVGDCGTVTGFNDQYYRHKDIVPERYRNRMLIGVKWDKNDGNGHVSLLEGLDEYEKL